MAPVNPTIQPRNDPAYGRDSRPVYVPDSIRPRGVDTNQILPKGQQIGDRSAEYAGQAAAFGSRAEGAATEGFADLFSGIARTADFLGKAGVEVVRKDIENKVYDVADVERQRYIAALEQLKTGGVGTRNILDANAGMDTPSGEEAPAEVADLGNRLEVLSSSRDSGKISSSYYHGRLLAEAKDLRAKYPGFRQEIDSAFARATGSNPANAYVHDLVNDINRNASTVNSSTRKTLNFLERNLGISGVPELTQSIINGEISGPEAERAAIQLIAPHERLKTSVEEHRVKMEDVNLGRSERDYHANKAFDKAAGGIINNAIDGVMRKIGLTDAQSVANTAEGLKNGSIDPRQWEQYGQDILRMKAQVKQQIISAADKYGITSNMKDGMEGLVKKLDARLTMFDDVSKLIYEKQTGTLFHLQRDAAAQLDEDKRDILRSPLLGPPSRQAMVLRSIHGDTYMNDLNLTLIRGKYPQQYQEFYNNWAQGIISQSEYGPTGKPVTFKDYLNELKSKNIDPAEPTKKIMGLVKDIGKKDPSLNDEVKTNIALAAFSPENRGMLELLNPSSIDAKGRRVTGQNAVFLEWTTPEITKEMSRLGEKNPVIWKQYVDWIENSLANTLLKRELADLNAMGEDNNLKISWDSDNKRLDVKYVGPMLPGSTPVESRGWMSQPTAFVSARSTLNRINSALYNFRHVAEASGQDVDTFMVQTLKNTLGDLKGISIPAQILQRIEDSRNFEGRFGASRRRGR